MAPHDVMIRDMCPIGSVNKFLISFCESHPLDHPYPAPGPHQASAHRRFNKKQWRAKHQVGTPLCPSIKTLKSLYSAWISTTMPLSTRMCVRARVRACVRKPARARTRVHMYAGGGVHTFSIVSPFILSQLLAMYRHRKVGLALLRMSSKCLSN